MRSVKTARRVAAACCGLLAAISMPAGAAVSTPPTPRVATGSATQILTSSAQLNAVVNPNGIATGYFFQYGPSTTYGLQTPTVSVGNGTIAAKVGQPISGLTQGIVYHYRVVGLYGAGQLVFGRDRIFTPKVTPPKLELSKIGNVTVGTPFILSGTLSGFGSAHRTVMLQASPFPYLQSFTAIGVPGTTDALGRFAFRVGNLTRSTEFRVVAFDLTPAYSPVLRVGAAPRVTFHARSSKAGLVRLYGTVSPTTVGAHVYIQLQKPMRPGPKSSEETATRFVTQFVTVVKRATSTTSRFSTIVRVRRGGRYRAYVRLKPGRLVSGYSTSTVTLHASKHKR
jgi:hypothetical protein